MPLLWPRVREVEVDDLEGFLWKELIDLIKILIDDLDVFELFLNDLLRKSA